MKLKELLEIAYADYYTISTSRYMEEYDDKNKIPLKYMNWEVMELSAGLYDPLDDWDYPIDLYIEVRGET